ncbi:MAG: LamG-like jellyroll fold domain-containing protein, partial [Planctomycetota bacterium]
ANGGGGYVNEFTLLFDVMYPSESAGQWRAFYQTGYEAYNDSEYFIHPSDESWGVGDLGYTDNATVGEFYSSHSTWYRAVLTVKLGDPSVAFHDLYINGQLTGKHRADNLGLDGRFSLYPSDDANPYICFAGDNDGEDALMHFSAIAIWGRPLTAEEIGAIGGPGDPIFGPGPQFASRPYPADGESDVCPDVVLSWTPGDYAPAVNGHRVYFSATLAEVESGTVGSAADRGSTSDPQFDTAALPFNLAIATTYHWRIDEANTVSGWDVGEVWQFTTRGIATIETVTATASSSDTGKGPENTIDLVGDFHSTDQDEMWLSSDTVGEWIEYDFGKVYKLHQMSVWNHNTEFENLLKFGVQNATITYSTDGISYDTLGSTHNFNQAPGTEAYAANTTIDLERVAARYLRITVNSTFGGPQAGLSEVRFEYVPGQAREPYSPISGATDVPVDTVLTWTPGAEAVTHEVYLSTNQQAVANGSFSPVSIPAGGECLTTYGPLSLEMGRTYYWKVNEVNLSAEPNVWEGEIWSFSTPEYILVEDFEGYTDSPGEEVFATWLDGYLSANNGSQIGHLSPPYLEGTDPVHGGSWSAPFYYNNTGSFLNSDATRTFDSPQNWNQGGIEALRLFFYGQSANSAPSAGEQMYVKLNGAKVAYDGDMADIRKEQWHQWDIDLAAFGINLASVTSISIGFDRGATPASGMVVFDDIRLYSSECILSRRSAGFAKVDYVDDCVINYKELEIMAGKWLMAASDPGTGNLVGWWKFDGNADDSSVSGANGIVYGTETWVAGNIGSALEFDGRTHVALGTSSDLNFGASTDFTVAFWANTVGWQDDAAMISNKDWNSGYNQGWAIACQGGGSGSWQWNYSDGDGARSDYDPSGPILSDGEWHHLCVAHDRGVDATFYFDGEYQAAVNISNNPGIVDAGYPTVVGCDGAEGLNWPYWFEGVLDDVRIYNTALAHEHVLFLSGMLGDLDDNSKIDAKDFARLGDMWLFEGQWP